MTSRQALKQAQRFEKTGKWGKAAEAYRKAASLETTRKRARAHENAALDMDRKARGEPTLYEQGIPGPL